MVDQLDIFKSELQKGRNLHNKKLMQDSLVAFQHALKILPNSVEAMQELAFLYNEIGNLEEAQILFEKIFKLQPDVSLHVHSLALEISKKTASWDIHERELNYIKRKMKEGKSIPPFTCLSEPFTNEELMQNVLQYNLYNMQFSPKPVYYSFKDRTFEKRKINLAFMSSDFKTHPVSYVISGLFERINQDLFNVFIYDIDPKEPDEHIRKKRIKTEGIFYQRIGKLNEKEVADLIFKNKIDILIDLNGFTSFNKLPVLTYRPAPVQATFLGYSGTIGKIPGVDFIICDKYILPPDQQKFYGERFSYLPCYFTYDTKNIINPYEYTKKNLGLPEKSFVLACFCNDYKYSKEYIDAWLRILKQTKNTVLWLFCKNILFKKNILKIFKNNGIKEDRIFFAHFLPSHQDHLARYRCVDILLDTQYYNAHTTAAEALYAGCPIITSPGETFASRVTGSILQTMKMPELIVKDLREYEEKVIFYATHPKEYHELKKKLFNARETSDFFNAELYAKNFEKMCLNMLEIYKKSILKVN